MATLTVTSSSLVSSSASLAGLQVSASSPASVKLTWAAAPVRAVLASENECSSGGRIEEGDMRRRGVMVGAVVAALAVVSDAASADESSRKKNNKCPKICVQNPTASCCFGK